MWALLICAVAPACGGGQKESKTAAAPEAAPERVEGISDTIALFKKKDSTIEQLFSTSAGYVVLPTVGKGALILGGAVAPARRTKPGATLEE